MVIAKTASMGMDVTAGTFGAVWATETIQVLGTQGDGEFGDRYVCDWRSGGESGRVMRGVRCVDVIF
ncbi:hypothetical protein THI4931_13270 [Pandoraea sputorum]|nr:hypothetical protein THI4931_13270 [Pandoraea sputorum]